MPIAKRQPRKRVRRSISLPSEIDRQVSVMAQQRHLKNSRLLVELIEEGIEAAKQRERAFYSIAERFRSTTDPEEDKRLGDELGRAIFGE